MSSLYLWLGGGKTQWLLWRGGELSPENILSLVCYRLKDHIVVIDIIIYDDDDEARQDFFQRHDHMLVGENVLGNYARSKG